MTLRPVLVVDDDAAMRQLATEALTFEGFAVQTASDGREALILARQCLPRLILLDLRMPEMDGTEFISRYRTDPGPHAPIVLMSATSRENVPTAGLAVAGCLPKPFDLDDLIQAVHRHAAGVPFESVSAVSAQLGQEPRHPGNPLTR